MVSGDYGPEHLNVAAQKRDPDSLWNFMRDLVQTYRECPEFGWGAFAILDQPVPAVLAHRCHWAGSSVIAVHNLGAQTVTTPVRLHPDDVVGRPWLQDLATGQAHQLERGNAITLSLDGYGHRWLRVRQDD
ncbi:MAG: hypothetical protein V4737_18050 [Curtobacterium sp.]